MEDYVDKLKEQIKGLYSVKDNNLRFENLESIYVAGRSRQPDNTTLYTLRNRNDSEFVITLTRQELHDYIIANTFGTLLNEKKQVAVEIESYVSEPTKSLTSVHPARIPIII